ncbi:peroxiredoxin [Monocercomonoides exilis]|uniref:peroxiredoxin n=1 Tax=Monocercomonoides exilis TaxID=2049356 RepID=UPI003559395C|nr:peroxiredoxin [Monocercomonoides exilis]|eukprot:MONOS_4535.1-p1 / transcript=MONOS_4535.1 / gene=MONOS_4535 / organism=Monocercomonoides_exilis_PA203 / gene_product=peroxiredoxin / transcript_product=peroxiredoxin / location=Mono_scaffold00121:102923-103450(+) / protein_length=176 / sequence_SO=supercontig / SO=protein_coding / is_pseudo=false
MLYLLHYISTVFALEIGEKAPDFVLFNQHGKAVNFSEQIGKGPVVVFFYPKDNSIVCTKEVIAFQALEPQFHDLGAKIFGISSDSVESHADFAKKHDLTYDLLADVNSKIRKEWDVPKALFLNGRSTYTFDENGILRNIFTGYFKGLEHATNALEQVKKLVGYEDEDHSTHDDSL